MPRSKTKETAAGMTADLRMQWNQACLAMGIPAISLSHAAITGAMLLIHGNHEAFTHNAKLVSDLWYIQRCYHLQGSEAPDPDYVAELQACVREMEQYEKEHGYNAIPPRMREYFRKMYGTDFPNNKNGRI